MVNGIDAMFYLFRKWIIYVFADMAFSYGTYSVSIGWIIVAVSVISMLIATILNIPRQLPKDAFYTQSGRVQKDIGKWKYRYAISRSGYRSYWKGRGED